MKTAVSTEVMNDKLYEDYMDTVKDVKSFSDAPSIEVNPFKRKLMNDITLKRKFVKGNFGLGSYNIVNHDGEIVSRIEENRVFSSSKYVDEKKFIKLYSDKLKDMFQLTHSAIKVFGYFLTEMQKPYNQNKDIIFFNLNDCMRHCDYNTHGMVYRGLTELISHGFIAKCVQPANHFFIDATIAFNGDRIVVMEEYIKKDADFFTDKKLQS